MAENRRIGYLTMFIRRFWMARHCNFLPLDIRTGSLVFTSSKNTIAFKGISALA